MKESNTTIRRLKWFCAECWHPIKPPNPCTDEDCEYENCVEQVHCSLCDQWTWPITYHELKRQQKLLPPNVS